MSDLRELAERVEAARADEQRDMLIAAFEVIFPTYYMPGRSGFGGKWPRFKEMLDAQAYESAAMTLVPEGFAWSLSQGKPFNAAGSCDAVLNNTVFAKNAVIAQAATPALALTAAALGKDASK